MTDPFEAPASESVAPGLLAVVVLARDYQNQSQDRRRALARLAGVAPERAEAIVGAGHPLVYATVPTAVQAQARAAFLRDVTALPITGAIPPNSLNAVVLLGLSVGLPAVLVMGDEPDLAIVGLALAPVGIVGTLWWHLSRRATFRGIPAALDARGLPEPAAELTDALVMRDHGFHAVVLLAAEADREEAGSDAWAAALLRLADVHERHGRHPIALRCIQRLRAKRPDDELVREAQLRLQAALGTVGPASTAPVRTDIGGAGPWRMSDRAVVRVHGPNLWPRRCPICNRLGDRSLRWRLRHNPGPDAPLAFILFLLVGPFGLLLAYLGSAVHAKTELWLCGEHHARLRRAQAAVWAVPVLVAALLGVAIAIASWWPALVAVLVGFLWIPALGERNVLRGRSSARGLMVLEGTAAAFVRELPELPPELVE